MSPLSELAGVVAWAPRFSGSGVRLWPLSAIVFSSFPSTHISSFAVVRLRRRATIWNDAVLMLDVDSGPLNCVPSSQRLWKAYLVPMALRLTSGLPPPLMLRSRK